VYKQQREKSMLVFLSYQMEDRHLAAEVSTFFEACGFDAFMAHEHIEVSHQWQNTIMEKLDEADIFVAVLTKKYLASQYCLQESGIAVFCEQELTVVPLSVDGTLPPGFMKHIQARHYVPGNGEAVLFSGIANFDDRFAIDIAINRLGLAGSYATAEKWFGMLRPHLARATPQQKLDVLEAAAGNNQFSYAWGCREGLLDLFERHGHRLSKVAQRDLGRVLAQ
jgi:TIR domain